jgi:hypothetical protein
MSRTTVDQYKNGFLFNGYDYQRQAWVINGVYEACNHPKEMWCGCFGRLNAGKPSLARKPQ